MKNNRFIYTSPNKKQTVALGALPLLATSLFSALTAQAADVPDMFAGEAPAEPNNITAIPKKIVEEPTTSLEKAKQLALKISEEMPPETMVFDIYAVGNYFGSVLVTYTDKWVEIDNPVDVLDQMPKVKDVKAFLPLLTGRIYAGESKELENVGSVSVDPKNFTLSIKVAQAQALAETTESKSIKRSTANYISFSSRMRMTGTTDFDPLTRDSLGLYHSMALSRGNWGAKATGNYIKNEGYDFANAVIEHNLGSNIYSAGMLNTGGVNLTSGANIYGVRIESNGRNNSDDASLKATPVEIFIPARGQVRIYRNESQIIYSEQHPFGMTTIDTKRFPTGSYDIRIEITDDTGTVTEERRFFQKDNSLISRERPQFRFTAGIQRDGLDMLSQGVYQFEYTTRLSDALELSANLYGVDTGYAFEPKLRGFFGNGYKYDAAFTMTSENDLSFTGGFEYNPVHQSDKASWFVRAQHAILGYNHDTTGLDEYDFLNNIGIKRTNVVAGMRYTVNDFTWSLNAQGAKNLNTQSTYTFGPSVNWRMYYNNGHRLSTQANITRGRNYTNHGVFLTYQYLKPLTKWQYKSSAGNASNTSQTYNKLAQDLSYNNRRANSLGSSFNVNNTASISNDLDVYTTNIAATHDMESMSFAANYNNVDRNDRPHSQKLDYTMDTTFLATRDSILDAEEKSSVLVPSMGGQTNNIIVKLKGNAIGEDVSINFNGIPKAYGKVGDNIAFSIPEYSGGKLTIAPSSKTSAMLDYNTAPVEITLFPGNIAQHEWVVNKVYLYMGRAVDTNGNPIAWQRIEGLKDFSTTDSNGFFQMELLGSETPYINTAKNQCVFALPPIKEDEQFMQIGDITCG
tara:strand:+ start:97691 stop:100252 length:2562 start_codon:yes stop_codon:yes gene_type:complete